MRSVLGLLVVVVALVSKASSSPLAPVPVAAVDSNTLVIAIGAVPGNEKHTSVTVVHKTSASNNTHQNGTSPPSPLVNTGGVVGPNNTIYIVGASFEDEEEQALFLSYDVQADKWTTLPPLTSEDEPASVVIVGTQLLSIGNYQFGLAKKQRDNGPGVYAFDLSAQSNQTWVEIPTPLPGSASSMCAVTHNDTLYYLVESGGLFRSSDAAQTWTQLAPASGPHTSASCAATDDAIVVAGGVFTEDNFALTAEVYDIAENKWHDTQPMSKRRVNAKAVVVPTADGESQVVVCGGESESTLSYKDCEQLDLSTNQWSPAGFTLDAQFIEPLFGLFVVTQN